MLTQWLGQTYNHIAALLYYSDHHLSDAELPMEKSKTSSYSMTWSQPPKKLSLQPMPLPRHLSSLVTGMILTTNHTYYNSI